ncbi:hypothetical protein AB0K18_33785 [Nonomuraea sp. NPDC049421]
MPVGIGMGMPGYQTPAETPERVERERWMTPARLLVAIVGLPVGWSAAG